MTVQVYDRSHWGRIQVRDRDRLAFLHNQSTQLLTLRKPGEVCETTFVTSTARTIDLATVVVLPETVLLIVSPGTPEKLIPILDRYIFFADKVQLKDITADTAMWSLIGQESEQVLKELGVEAQADRVVSGQIAGCEVQVIAGSGLASLGWTIVCASADRSTVGEAISAHAVSLDDAAFERLRIEQGRPMPGAELTDDYNPLDVGLWHTVSFTKGCYIGQETIARLESRDAVKLNLWGLQLKTGAAAGDLIFVNGEKAGSLTSVCAGEEGTTIALGYVRRKAAGKGAIVQVQTSTGEQSATLLDLPFAVREKV